MRSTSIGLILSIAATALPSTASAQDQTSKTESTARDLFDGRTLEGWRGDERLWRVEDGILVGSTGPDRKISRNTFLIWQGGEVADFDLRVELRVTGKNNSGVQYRSRVTNAEAYAVAGYQADVHPNPPYAGMLYEEGGRGILAQRGQRLTLGADGSRKVEGRPSRAAVRIDDWFELRIVARGPKLTHYINGERAVEIVDRSAKARRRGVIALQLHRGPAMKLEVRRIRLTEFEPAPEEKTSGTPTTTTEKAKPRAATTTPDWIWLGKPRNDGVVFFRRVFDVRGEAKAVIAISCDNGADIWLDGKKIGKSGDWFEHRRLNLGKLAKGKHVLAIRAKNDGGPAGLLATVRIGKNRLLHTDRNWKATRREQTGDAWTQIDFDDKDWRKSRLVGTYGGAPWGNGIKSTFEGLVVVRTEASFASRKADELQIPHAGFEATCLATIPRGLGSWVSLCAAPDGSLYASDQRSGLYRIEVGAARADGTRTTKVTRMPVALGGAQGLCFVGKDLYASVNGRDSGLWKVTDTDGDGKFDDAKRLVKLVGAGEHGPHALMLTPDKKAFYLVCGNRVALPEGVTKTRIPYVFDEDRIPEPIVDPNGHATKIRAPGGYICKVSFDGKEIELLTVGFRNAFDIAVDPLGEIFAYDADMEWDFGLPWYRPTRIVHAVPGADFGWRTGSAKWATHAEDSLPPVHEIGPGSPTALLFGTSARFPPEWRRKLFAFDWTFGTIWALDLIPDGSTFRAKKSVFVAGKPLPLTDAAIGKDGAMYFLTGGRGTETRVYRVHWAGSYDEILGQSIYPIRDEALVALRKKLESRSVDKPETYLDHADRFVRHAARMAFEGTKRDLEAADSIDGAARPLAATVALVARARHLARPQKRAFFERLASLPFANLERPAKLAYLRSCEIAIARQGKPRSSTRKQLPAQLDPALPSGDASLDAELARILCALDSKTVVAKCIDLMDGRGAHSQPEWASVLERNDRYGKPIRRMLDNPPPTVGLHYADCLRMARSGWTPARRERVFEFLRRARKYPAGNSYRGYVDKIRDAYLETMSAADKRRVGPILASWNEKRERFTPPKGPGRAWSTDEALKLVEEAREAGTLANRSYRSGRNLFHSIGCARCHRHDGDGGGIGPDLTTASSKYSTRELLESLIEPQRVIADQFVAKRIEMKNGTVLRGQVVPIDANDKNSDLEIWPATVDSRAVRIRRAQIENIRPDDASPMPAKLLDGMNADELLDLIAFLIDASAATGRSK